MTSTLQRIGRSATTSRARRLGHAVRAALVILAVVVWVVALRPQALGGPAQYVVIRGSSMLPTYDTGDLVVVQAAPSFAVGDVVAYRVPEGQIGEGHLLIHRLVGGDGETGFSLRGDNNEGIDPWQPRTGDIVGRAWFAVPGLGRVVAFVHQPVILGAIAAAVVVFLVLVGPPLRRGRRDEGQSSAATLPEPPTAS